MRVHEFLEELRNLAEVTSLTLSDHVRLAWAVQAPASAGGLQDQYSVGIFGSKYLAKDLQ